MKKKSLILLLMFIVIMKSSFSAEIAVDETELVSLVPKAYDPDQDELIYSYSAPLDENGKWQTDYGDAGQYDITVTVSDGESSTTKEVLLVVNKKEESPVIESYEPDAYELSFKEGERIDFKVSASDLNNDELSYIWELDGEIVSKEDFYAYIIDYEQEGNHSVVAYVSDGRSIASQEWTVDIKDVDRAVILEQISDVEVEETGVVKLNLPDFGAHNLEYSISEPVGDDNYWKTDYDDAGEYKVKVSIKDGSFEASKEVNVKVNNADRKPELEPIGTVFMKENQRVIINLSAVDPDGDPVSYSAEDLPEGASLVDGSFIWHPGYDAIKREGLLNVLLDKYHLLSKIYGVKFIAESGGLKDEGVATIIVSDVNRKPKFEPVGDIIVNEGSAFVIDVNAADPDGDSIRYSYSGWVNQDRGVTRFGDAGTYKVTVTASDGWLSSYQDVNIIVRKVNRAPVLREIGEHRVYENETVYIELKASDPDGDELRFYNSNLTGAYIEGNVFKWRPSFDFVEDGEEAYANVIFTVSDGGLKAEQDAIIIVDNVNRKPEIVETSIVETVNVGKPVVFEVMALDPDGDKLQYVWKFGFFDKYEGKGIVKRIFTSKGDKKVEVIVSDGLDDVSYTWNVKVG